MTLLEFEQLSYRYPGAAEPALREVTLTLAPGELVLVAGESGSGKSTLLRAACGLVPHFHGGTVSGRATVAGMDTRRHGPGELAAAVGTLFQDPETQIVMGTVRAELAFALENRGASPLAIARSVEETALALAIDHLLERSTAELSGGELQRVALGATLAGGPSLVVLDEPTSQLDPVAGDELISLLRRINEDFDTTILLAEHRLERCLPAADRVLAMDAGRIVCDAAPEDFLVWATAHAPLLTTPGAQLLCGAGLAPAAGVKRARAALRQAGRLPERPLEPDRERPRRRRRVTAPHGRIPQPPVLELDHAWCELREGPVILRDVSLRVSGGERVALMGRNGAGKSTLLRHAAGLEEPTRGRVLSSGRVALLLQSPGDYLIHERVGDETSAASLAAVGLDPQRLFHRHPRELSGGERQRLALAIVLDRGGEEAAVVCLDEPTRGIDRGLRRQLVALLTQLPAAVIVATHDPEFVAAFAQRTVLLADGGVIADGPVREVLTGGSYFATETARILGGAGGALSAQEGIAVIGGRLQAARGGALEVLR